LGYSNYDWHNEWGQVPTNTYSNVSERIADIYVFCVLTETNRQLIDPLNTDQWSFMVVPTEIINKKFDNQKSVGLSALQKLDIQQVSFVDLKAEINKTWVNKESAAWDRRENCPRLP
jgi:hypothetical protein